MSDAAPRTLAIALTLTEKDLDFFEGRLKAASEKLSGKPEAEIIAAVKAARKEAEASNPPDFVASRISKLDPLIAMLEDEVWALPEEHRKLVVGSLAYFADPDDIIPDNVQVFGYLDDAIMIDLVCGSLEPELAAYEDFCEARDDQGDKPDAAALAAERTALQARMSRRRRRRRMRAAFPAGVSFNSWN